MKESKFTCEYILKCGLHICRVEGRGLDEAETVSFSECLCLVSRYRAQMPQITLVAN